MLIIALIIISTVSIGIGVVALMKLQALTARFSAALGGSHADSLETTLASHIARVEEVDKRLEKLTAEYDRLAITGATASQKISIVRFNPFGDTGGDQVLASPSSTPTIPAMYSPVFTADKAPASTSSPLILAKANTNSQPKSNKRSPKPPSAYLR